MIKFCRDCKWSVIKKRWLFFHDASVWAKCLNPDCQDDIDYFIGGDPVESIKCRSARAYGKCGKEGNLWEAKAAS
jgi:hypothetical protein